MNARTNVPIGTPRGPRDHAPRAAHSARAPRFTRAHAWIAGIELAAFALLTCAATSGLLSASGAERVGRATLTTLATPLGPFTGAIAREWQTCCAANSWSLLPFALLALGTGVLFQLVPLRATRTWRVLRLAVWGCGWFAWFASGIASLAHALE